MDILLVDDDDATRDSLAGYLTLLGHGLTARPEAASALEAARSRPFDLILSDINMPGISGIELVRAVAGLPVARKPDVVLYTGHSDLGLAIGALRAGAYDYLTKPINLEELGAVLDRVAEHQRLLAENDRLTNRFDEAVAAATTDARAELGRLRALLAEKAGLAEVGIFSEAMWRVVEQAKRYHEDRGVPVLIQGETGVGKEIVARIIHYGPNQAALPFVDINCTALSPGLFESELFGYEAGAYTGGAGRGGRGKLDIAQGGTLFLDELAEIPVELQAKLLRVIEERSFYRVGGLAKIATDIRIVAAANIDFEEHISRGLFRKDLYYRLRVGSIVVPPLRKRPDDIVPLARMFLRSFAKKRGKALAEISPEAAAVLLAHAWPGNVRELRNAMEWVSVMHDGAELVPGHLAGFLSGPAARAVAAPSRSRTSRPGLADIDAAIAASGGNKTEAAARLGMSIRMLHYRLKNRSAS